MTYDKYDAGLSRNAANFTPLSPLTFLRRAANVFPDHIAIIHGDQRTPFSMFWPEKV